MNVACHTGACKKNTPFGRALALQHSGINCSPAPGLVFFKLNFPRVFLSGGVFFSDTSRVRMQCTRNVFMRYAYFACHSVRMQCTRTPDLTTKILPTKIA